MNRKWINQFELGNWMHYRYRYRCVSSIYSYHIASSRFRKKNAFFGCVIILKFWNLQREKNLIWYSCVADFFAQIVDSNDHLVRRIIVRLIWSIYRILCALRFVFHEPVIAGVCRWFFLLLFDVFFFRKLCFCFIRCLFQCSGFDRANVWIFNIVTYAHMDVCVSVCVRFVTPLLPSLLLLLLSITQVQSPIHNVYTL